MNNEDKKEIIGIQGGASGRGAAGKIREKVSDLKFRVA